MSETGLSSIKKKWSALTEEQGALTVEMTPACEVK